MQTSSTSFVPLTYFERSKTCGHCWTFAFGAQVLTCTIIQLRISISFISTESCSICSPMHQEHSAMADGGKGPPSTSAMLPATITDDAPPTRSHTSLSGTTATSSPAGDASAGATGSAHETSRTATNIRKHHECANCSERATDRCGGCAEGLDGNGEPSSTYYCSQTCLKGHPETHKGLCKLAIDRRQLFRIGALVQCAFYTGTKAMWYHEILELRKLTPAVEDDNAVVREVEHALGASDKDRRETKHAVGTTV